MHYKDNFEEAVSRLTYAHSIVHNAGYHRSDRDFHLAEKLRVLLHVIADSKLYYDENGKLKEMYE
jgi:hypothetical protein